MRVRLDPAVTAMLSLLAAALLAVAGADGVRPAPVAVPRCCSAGRTLAADALQAPVLTRAAAAASCVEDAEARPWAPRVYAPARNSFLKPGQLPPHWRLADGALPACADLRVLPADAAPYALLANNGSIMLRSPPRVLPTTRYCADHAAALLCLEDDERPPSKCCGAGKVYDGAGCVPDDVRAAAAWQELRTFAGEADVSIGWPACPPGMQYSVSGELAKATLEGNGSLRLASGLLVAGGAWCAEAVEGSSGTRVLACAAEAQESPRSPRHLLYGCGLAVGAAFLAATLAAGCALPAAHHALHWRCQTQYVASLMLADILLAGTQLAADQVPPALCRALAVCMHFLFLAAFFWLNTMCFNIWWTFRDFRPTSLERGQESWRLRVYTVYAWGGPLCIAGIAALLDALPPPPEGPDLLRPRFGDQRCWFYGDAEILVYFFGPVGVLLLVNLALFVSTTRQLTCGLWRRDEVKSTSERAALGRVCAKLVVVMGVTWGADVVSWVAGGPEYVWYGTDLLNALQGVLIFLVVGAQPAALAALRDALARCCRAPAPPARRRPDRATHSSTHLPSCGESLTNTTAAPPSSAAPPAPAKVPMETVC
ncbi:probable G-protein coupled receptor Mth-like 1 [Cydia strobilella]|uniref:probable G-protein coupled receptor Mth-like 1 n=1 Tax=Cydia strobilella TaxID=1100964 RepID=UPI003004F688